MPITLSFNFDMNISVQPGDMLYASSLVGGQGGSMRSKGHAYIGSNPVDSSETNESNTKVKLLPSKVRNK